MFTVRIRPDNDAMARHPTTRHRPRRDTTNVLEELRGVCLPFALYYFSNLEPATLGLMMETLKKVLFKGDWSQSR